MKNRGITLIALVITIIVLIILAGVSINLTLGENGLFNKAKMAVEEYKIESAREKLELAIAELATNKQRNPKLSELNEINKEDIEIQIKQDGSVEIFIEDTKNYTLAKVDGYYFKVYHDMTVEFFRELTPEENKEPEYIKEGLVVWYDGINNTRTGHSDTTNIWENLVEDANNGILKNIDFNNVSGWTNNSLILDGVNDWVQMTYLEYDNITVEIVAKPLDVNISKEQIYITNAEVGGIGIWKSTNNKNTGALYSKTSKTYVGGASDEDIKINQKYSMSVSYDGEKVCFCENNNIYTKEISGGTLKPDDTTVYVIGTNPEGSSEVLTAGEVRANIEVYSVRIYNRALSQEEIQHNYEIDKTRFNIEKLSEPEELGYVKDGLVCLYDGKQNTKYGHSNKTGVWQNLVGDTINGTLKNINHNEESGWTNNSLILDGVNDWVQMAYLYYDNMTVEIVAKPVDVNVTSKYQYYISNAENGGIAVWKNSDNKNEGVAYSKGSGTYSGGVSTEDIRINQIYSMSTSYDGTTIYFSENGKLYTKEQPDSVLKPGNSTLYAIGTNLSGSSEGIASGASRGNIKVYSVRIYNRALSQEEIQHNYQIDKDRFDIEKLPEQEELGYVQDGLVCLYDGEQNTKYGHSKKTTTWQNLNGTINFGLKNINNTSTSGWTNNSLILDGSNDWAILDTFMHYSNMTIEMVVKPLTIKGSATTSYAEYYLTNIEVGGMGLYKSSANKIGVSAYIGGSYKYTISDNLANVGTIYSLSTGYNGSELYFRENGGMYKNQVTGSFTKPDDSTRFALATNPEGASETLTSGAARSNIEVYSVRIYNRCLSEEEIQANYLIDKQRFNIQ